MSDKMNNKMNIDNQENQKYFERAKKVTPGGVHSPVRSFKGLGMPPIFVERASGAYIYEGNGSCESGSSGQNNYIDFCMSFGPLILGHKDPEVEEALRSALSRGWSYGACERYSLELAEYILSKISFIDQIRFMNSGTEAVMTAIRLARAYTAKNKIIKFNGCYHGHCDSMLIKAGSGVTALAEASSSGVPKGVAEDTLVLELGDIEGVKKILTERSEEIAAIIIEPLPANYGLLIQNRNFLEELRKLSSKCKSSVLLIFDEVISGFRVNFGGMSTELGIIPDLVTYGKIIGGGLPVGAVAGRREIMEQLAPIGGVYQAGTLSANPLAMVAGLHTLKKLNDNFYKQLENYSMQIVSLFKQFLANYQMSLVHYKSLIWPVPINATTTIAVENGIENLSRVPSNLSEKFLQIFHDLIKRGVYLAPNAYEVGFISGAHDQSTIEDLKQRLQ